MAAEAEFYCAGGIPREVMTWFGPSDSFDHVPVVLLQLKMRERKNQTVTVIFDPASVTAEFEVWIRRNYGETVGVNRSVQA